MHCISRRVWAMIFGLLVASLLADAGSSWFVAKTVDFAIEMNPNLSPTEERFFVFLMLPPFLSSAIVLVFLVVFAAPRPWLERPFVVSVLSTVALISVMVSISKIWLAAENMSLWLFGNNLSHILQVALMKLGFIEVGERSKVMMLSTVVSLLVAIPGASLFFRWVQPSVPNAEKPSE